MVCTQYSITPLQEIGHELRASKGTKGASQVIVKVKQILLNVAAISTVIMLLFFTLIGVDVVLKIGTFWGYIFTVLCGVTITSCVCYVVIHASKALKEQVK